MPTPYAEELRDDAVRVARNRESGATIDRIARASGVHPVTPTQEL